MLFSNKMTFAQDSLQIVISENYNVKPLKDIINELEDKHPLYFFYKENWIANTFVTAKSDSLTIYEFLDKIFEETGITYEFNSNYVILFKKTRKNKLGNWNQVPKEVTLSGYVIDPNTGYPIVGATIYIIELNDGTITDGNGFYKYKLMTGEYHIEVSSTGLLTEKQHFFLSEDLEMNFEMLERLIRIKEINIKEEADDDNIAGTQMGKTLLSIKTLKHMPAVLGEVDIVRTLVLLPGVSTIGEATSGYNVRGGSPDQNLILFDNAPIFNASHFFGFYSAFNTDAVKDVALYRSGIPARFGGRISSVLNVAQKEGNSKKFTGNGGLGFILSRLTLEGPIIKGKASFIVGGRITYSDWILNKLPNADLQNSSAHFYDVNAKINHKINDNNRFSISAYLTTDGFKLASDTLFEWGAANATMKWYHAYSDKFASDFNVVFSNNFSNISGLEKDTGYELKTGIKCYGFSSDFAYYPNTRHKIDFGATAMRYSFLTGELVPDSKFSSINEFKIPDEQSLETAIYFSDEFIINGRISILYGLRYSLFLNLGPGDVATYNEDFPKSTGTILNTKQYDKNSIIKYYHGLEPRFSFKYSFTEKNSTKISYQRMRQYLHLISNTTSIKPIDVWKTSDSHIKPQIGDQVALGYFHNFSSNEIETSIEFYYKKIQNILDYKAGARLLLNEQLETDLLEGNGRAYGIEISLRKNKGRLTGWASYSFSRTERQIDGGAREEKINNGHYYPSDYDKPHDFTMVAKYIINRRLSFNLNFTYSTGRPLTVPSSKYAVDNIWAIANYSERNTSRIPDYHRLDISFTYSGNLKRNKKWDNSWTFSIYNIYGRRNAYSVFFKPVDNAPPQAYKLSIFGSPVPSLTYNFKF
jgi:hypothetical protein